MQSEPLFCTSPAIQKFYRTQSEDYKCAQRYFYEVIQMMMSQQKLVAASQVINVTAAGETKAKTFKNVMGETTHHTP